MFIAGIGTAVPESRYTQLQCWEALQQSPALHLLLPRSVQILKKVLLGDNGIRSRHLAMNSLTEAFNLSPDVLQHRFDQNAPRLAAQAGSRALEAGGRDPAEIDGLIISTCTGYLCPGLTSYVSEILGLRPNIVALDLVGQGCGAALPNMSTGQALLASGRCQHVLSVCVEVCSAALYLDDDPGVLISACLFGDAAGAAVLSAHQPRTTRCIQWRSCRSFLDPGARHLLRFESRGGMLRNILAPEVPAIAARHAASLLDQVLKPLELEHRQIATWIWHAGGKKVLAALQQELELTDQDVHWSAAVLENLGNVSSPFVYHVLECALQNKAPNGLWWIGTFGAGFSSHGALLHVS